MQIDSPAAEKPGMIDRALPRRGLKQPARASLHPSFQSGYTERMPHAALPDALPPDPVIEAYKKDIDRTLLRETLKLTPAQRLQRLQDVVQTMELARGAARPKTASSSARLTRSPA